MNTDLITTILGAIGAAVVAAEAIFASGSVNWGHLVVAVGIAVFGYFTNKQPKDVQPGKPG